MTDRKDRSSSGNRSGGSLSQRSRRVAHRLETRWDRLRLAAKRRLGLTGTPLIAPFRGYGDAARFWVRGRVIEDQGALSAAHTESLLRNIVLTARRYETDEIPEAQLAWSFARRSGEVVTDEEGYFDFSFAPGEGFDPHLPWQDVHFILRQAHGRPTRPLGATVRVRTPSPEARFGLISDIDDTIVFTGATNFLKHWRTVAMNSAESRVPFAGTAPFYTALAGGAAGPETNPIFYVSSSPWNLFDLFERFMVLHGIPFGPMLLKDFGLDEGKWLTGGHQGHKTRMIAGVMDTYPTLKFILVGDSGQKDAEIYRDIVGLYPGRVAAVFIRDVTPWRPAAAAEDLLRRLEEEDIAVAYSPDLVPAAEISAERGWIDGPAVDRVRRAAAEAAAG